MTCRLIDRYPETGDDAFTLTDNDTSGSISMTMIFELHAVALDDEYNFSRYFSIFKIVFINNILHLQISFIVHITFSLLLTMILSLVGIILLTPRFCTTTSITIFSLSLSYFHPFQSVVDQWLVQQQTTLKDCCCRFVCWFTEKMNGNGKSVKNSSNSRERTMKVLLKNFREVFTNFSKTRAQKNEYNKCWVNFWSKWMRYSDSSRNFE